MPLNSQLYSLLLNLPQLFTFPVTCYKCTLERRWGSMLSFLGVFSWSFSKNQIAKDGHKFNRKQQIGNPSAKCLGKTFKNLENILSSPLGFLQRENTSIKLSRASNLLVVAAAAVHSVPPGLAGGSVYPMPLLQQDLAVGKCRRLCCVNLNIQDMKLYLLDVKGRICFANLQQWTLHLELGTEMKFRDLCSLLVQP